LVFKGGTLLNKVYVGFYRMSEDLDFSISVSSNITKKERSNLIQPIKKLITHIESKISALSLREDLTGYNNSTQYNACFQYQSSLSDQPGNILFEIGLREEILNLAIDAYASTLVKNPLTDSVLITPYLVRCLTKTEAYAEKLRAALTRKKPAIRDLFDLDYAIRTQVIDTKDPSFQDLLKTKLIKPQSLKIDLSNNKKDQLRAQLPSDLKPILRRIDFEQFDFDKAWSQLVNIYEELQDGLDKVQ
jgi:predicted nucleotidyltransferase component of viral defense system